MEIKKELAGNITDIYHGAGAGQRARTEFENVFSRGWLPDDIKDYACGEKALWIVQLLKDAGLTKSNGEARRMIEGGAVSIDGERINDTDAQIEVSEPVILKVGKRRYRRLIR